MSTPTPGLGRQIRLLFGRFVRISARNPWLPLTNLATSVFFLVAYDGALGGSEVLIQLTGGNYANFVLPVALLFVGLTGSIAGSLLLQDVTSGYLQRQLSMPLSRFAIVLAPVLLGATLVAAQAVLVIAFAVLVLGADPAAGPAGVLCMLAISVLWGAGFAGYSVAIGLRTKSAFGVQAASLVTFPLIFLSPLFVPMDQLKDWMQAVATVNPTTYVLGGMRSLLTDGWQTQTLIEGLVAASLFGALAMGFAAVVARQETRRS